MFKRTLLLTLALFLVFSGTTLAQGEVSPQHSDPFWQASYWNNLNFSGAPTIQRTEPNLDFNWGNGSPDGAIPADNFGARWMRYIDVPAGAYRFTVSSDDGVRVWLDNELIMSEWYDHALLTKSVDRTLTAGHHLLVVDYYERTGTAAAKLTWEPVQSAITNWRGEYYTNAVLGGPAALVRDDTNINFNWGYGSQADGVIPSEYFSARWTRTQNLPAGQYRFAMTVDDGGRLWVNEHLLIDAWWTQAPRTYTGDIFLPGGPVTLRMEYFENTGGAVAQLSWSTGGGTTPPPASGDVIVDNGGAGFVKGGSSTAWRTSSAGYNGSLWTYNNAAAVPNYNWANWYPSLAPARYEVFVYVPSRNATAQTRYWVSHAGGFTQMVVNQALYSNQWVSLGTYSFQGTNKDYVSLSDVTYEPYLSKLVAFDAVKWSPR